MAYILPRVQIEQEFTQNALFAGNPLAAFIVGPQYDLYRYDVADEKANTKTVEVDGDGVVVKYTGEEATFAYPKGFGTGALDAQYTKVYFSEAVATYYPIDGFSNNSASTASKIGTGPDYNNRFQLSLEPGHGLVDLADYPRSQWLADRDVQVGDYLTVHASPADLTYKIRRILREWLDASATSVATVANAATGTDGTNTIVNFVGAPTVDVDTYSGSRDVTYTVTVMRTGKWYDGSTNGATCARVKVTSNDSDSSPEFNVAKDTWYPVGALGLKLKFTTPVPTGTSTTTTTVSALQGLISGNTYTVAVTAGAYGAYNQVEVDADMSTVATSTFSLSLVQNDVQIPIGDTGTQNWEITTANKVKLAADIAITNTLLVDSDASLLLPVTSADVYIEYRVLNKDNVASITSLSSAALVSATLGAVHPDNPLAEGVYDALLNSSGAPVYYMAVSEDSLAGYNYVLSKAKESKLIYSFVPLTFDTAVQDAFVAHIEAMSSSIEAKWRTCYLSSAAVETEDIYDIKASTGQTWKASIKDDPNLGGAEKSMIEVTGATFTTDVREGDTVQINFLTDSFGNVYPSDTRTITTILSNTQLLVDTPFDALTTEATRVKIVRNYSKEEQVAAIAAQSATQNKRRVNTLFPDYAYTGGVKKDGYYLAAAVAGLRSGVVPHQGLTNVPVLGFDDMSRSSIDFTYDQLNVMAEAGVWILIQDAPGATPYTRHQLTTDMTGLNFSENSITTNVDSIAYGLARALAPFIGVYNVNPTNVLLVRNAIRSELQYRANNTFTVRAGNQLNGFTINSVTQNTTFKDRVDVAITLDVPAPMNFINVTLTV